MIEGLFAFSVMLLWICKLTKLIEKERPELKEVMLATRAEKRSQ